MSQALHVDDLPAVCISLDRRPDRWRAFKEGADAAGLTVKRQSAVDAKTFDAVAHPSVSLGVAHNIKFKTRRSHHEIDSAGAVGCSLSHFEAWQSLLDSGAPAMIIFEDDAPVPTDFKPRLTAILRQLPAGWDMVQFQLTVWDHGVTGCKPIQGQEPWQLCTALMGSYAYMISRAGAEKMLARAYPIEMHVDAYMAYMSKMGHIRMLWHPMLDIPGPEMDSDIAHGRQGILTVPTDMRKAGVMAIEEKGLAGLLAMTLVAGGLLALAFVGRR